MTRAANSLEAHPNVSSTALTKDIPSTAKNLQLNLICKCKHQTVGNMLRVLLYSNPPQNLTQARDIVNQALATERHAMRVTTATTLCTMQWALAFSHDMFLNGLLTADWHTKA
jgi:F0F1-type ATP synthase delta subunit